MGNLKFQINLQVESTEQDLCNINFTTMTELVELFQFLDSPNPAARQIALTNLLGHTAKNDPERHMFIPSVTGGLGGGGLLPQKRSAASEDDERKIKALRDLCGLCRDQPVRRSVRAAS